MPTRPLFEFFDYPQVTAACNPGRGIYFARARDFLPQENSPMKTSAEILLTALALTGLYCATVTSSVRGPVIGAAQTLLVADGSDPMPLCRGRSCK